MRISAGVLALVLLAPLCLQGQAVKVLHRAGAEHGFLVLRNASGALLASGEITQAPYRQWMKMRVLFHFLDGSVDDEITVYSQDQTFRLVSDRHRQSGPAFPHPMDMTVDVEHQQVSVRDLSVDHAAAKSEHMELPPELANGVLFLLLQNLSDGAAVEVPYVASTPKPRMVKLAIAPEGEARYQVAGHWYPANRYDIKVHLGGAAAVIAPMIGKQPSDYHVWVSKSSVPVILRIDGSLYADGPVWSVQLASPSW